MKLYYTPRSHFSRKVRILLDAWGIDAELIDVGNVADTTSFGDNPLMKVPALGDGSTLVLESDHIAEYLVRKHDPEDRFSVLTSDVDALNARGVLNGTMDAEVQVILARRTGLETDGLARFEKLLATIREGLDWLEARADLFDGEPSYLGFHLVCLWDHVRVTKIVELRHPRLRERVARLSELPFVARSAPA